MALQGAAIIAQGTLTEATTITATDPALNNGFTDTLDNFDVIGVNFESDTSTVPGRVRFRRDGQGSFDTSYITYSLGDSGETYDAADTHLLLSNRTQRCCATFYNVGLAAPIMMFSGDIKEADGFARTLYGIHNQAAVCDALELSMGTYDNIPYTVWGVYKGLSKVIRTVDLANDMGASDLLITADGDGVTLDSYEQIRFVTVGRTPNSGRLEAQVREQGGSVIGTGAYVLDFFQIATSSNIAANGHRVSSGIYGQLALRGFGLPIQTHGQVAYYGGTNAETVGVTHDVDSDSIHDAINLITSVTLTGGTAYVTGILKS